MNQLGKELMKSATLRKSTQDLLPIRIDKNELNEGAYQLYPFKSIGRAKVFHGFDSLVDWIVEKQTVIIDGFTGVFWELFRNEIASTLEAKSLQVNFIKAEDYMYSSSEIQDKIQDFLGEDEAVWGTKCTLVLEDFFRIHEFKSVKKQENVINICIGTGAGLIGWDDALVYVDLPKNELQYRMHAGTITNFGMSETSSIVQMYKHSYFIDWVVLGDYKRKCLPDMDVIVDGQHAHTINWSFGSDLREALQEMSESIIRVRPWFQPGAWGGQWIKDRIPGLNKDVVNYAWSFALIVPENGIILESDGWLLEVSFDFLMFAQSDNVLGENAEKFQHKFPIRFNFLDTVEGGNLSIQCHPNVPYIQKVFGEHITQDETYYILDCEKDAKVYLGFQDSINEQEFRGALENSLENNVELNIADYVQIHNASKHDFFLIPNGTVHSSATGNMVLEISATPYIFTFKMYDWLRLDLNGKPRPINLEHAFANLDFELKGKEVEKQLFSKPYTQKKTDDYEVQHFPTHYKHFYDIRRIDLKNEVVLSTEGSPQVMMVVEGTSVVVETKNGERHILAYAESFVIPASAGTYTLKNESGKAVKVINAFLKP